MRIAEVNMTEKSTEKSKTGQDASFNEGDINNISVEQNIYSGAGVQEHTSFHRKNTYPRFVDILAIVGAYLAGALFASLVMVGVLHAFPEVDAGLLTTLTYSLQFFVMIGLVVAFRKMNGAPKVRLKITFRLSNMPLILLGLVLLMASSIVLEPLLALFPVKYLESMYSSIGNGGWAILTTVVLAPILEETMFRGLLLEPVRQKMGTIKAILISSFIFGLIHVYPQQAINAFVVALILGYVYVKTDSSLSGVIIIHGLNNAFAYLTMELLGEQAVSATTRELVADDRLYFIIYSIAAVVFLSGMVYIFLSARKLDPSRDNR